MHNIGRVRAVRRAIFLGTVRYATEARNEYDRKTSGGTVGLQARSVERWMWKGGGSGLHLSSARWLARMRPAGTTSTKGTV
jgi:hypothetical protein